MTASHAKDAIYSVLLQEVLILLQEKLIWAPLDCLTLSYSHNVINTKIS